MCREKSIFAQMVGTYAEIDGILYLNLIIGNEEMVAILDAFSGKYGDLWKWHLKENQPKKYYHLFWTGQLQQRAEEVNEEAHEMLENFRKWNAVPLKKVDIRMELL